MTDYDEMMKRNPGFAKAAEQGKRLADAAPEMLETLEAIANFWSEYEKGNTNPSLSPYAYLTEGEEAIVDRVRRVVRKAREGQ